MIKLTYLVTDYNENKTVKRAIEDIININFLDKEIIIIDNGSTDGSQQIIKTFGNKKGIKIILRKKDILED